jgi:hypothetical protein
MWVNGKREGSRIPVAEKRFLETVQGQTDEIN